MSAVVIYLDKRKGEACASPSADALWSDVVQEARAIAARDIQLTGLVTNAVLIWRSLADCVAHRLAARLGDETISPGILQKAFSEAFAQQPELVAQAAEDLRTLASGTGARACAQAVIYSNAYMAQQAHRMAHRLWTTGRRDMALLVQSRAVGAFNAHWRAADPPGAQAAHENTTPRETRPT